MAVRVLIVGGGGLGTVLAAHLAHAGVDATLFVRPAQAAALADGAVHTTGLSTLRAAVRVEHRAERLTDAEPFDFLVLCVKARHTESALAPLVTARVPVAVALSLQNGVGKDELLARAFGAERVLGAITSIGGTLQRPGRAMHTLAGPTLIGELDGSVSDRSERLAAAIRVGGLPAESVPNILEHEWHKVAMFLPGALVCPLARVDMATSLDDPEIARVRTTLLKETAAIAAAEGHPVEHRPIWFVTAPRGPHDPPPATIGGPFEAIVTAFAVEGAHLRAQGVTLYPSTAQDFFAGRPSEIPEIAGDLVERAGRRGVAAPTITALMLLLRAMERTGSALRVPTLPAAPEP